jgi:hypothetical protein
LSRAHLSFFSSAAGRATLALVPQLARQNKSSTGAHVHCAQARSRPGEQTPNAKGAGLDGMLVLSRAAFVLSRRTRSPILSMRIALEVMQRNFGKAVNADRNDRCPYTCRGIAHHLAMFPRSGPHMAGQDRIKRDWDTPRQTDLTTVSMATHKKFKTSMCGLAVDFRRMGQQD